MFVNGVCEKHLITDKEVLGPPSLNYRVAADELRKAVSGVDVLLYEESIKLNSESERVASARMVVKNNR